ncbi:YdeI/OmpD-associated family protein [Arenibacter certesii]|uniref:YdeI/OmpD-associated family protein n=1 Tax=Arenibacter certesii TaxID=228955 RepID=UPI0027E4DD9E|nr:YdeI/OmpD-associated family protein [Arenibacter certesii]
MEEAILNQRQGKVLKPEKKKPFTIPPLLKLSLNNNPELKANFKKLTPYKQREYCEYIDEAK